MRTRRRHVRYYRAPHLMLHWTGDRLVADNYADRRRIPVSPFLLNLLDRCTTAQTAESLARVCGLRTPALKRTLDVLAKLGLLRKRDAAAAAQRDIESSHWDAWKPAARFFHVTTKDVRFGGAPRSRQYLRDKIRRVPRPVLTKRVSGRSIKLEPPDVASEFPKILLQRRTWRAFGRRPLEIASLSTLLNLTSGVQAWTEAEIEGRVALKTSPSGGARHPIETYLAVLRCSGLRPGLYHYGGDRHSLTRIGAVTGSDIRRFLPQQRHFATAGAIVFFTAVVGRTMWRYPNARAYRALLIEAGHVCQTFCLTATWLGLAPFCTMALADTAIEQALGLDGASEIVLYAAGAGTRPAGATWMPRPDKAPCHMRLVRQR